MLRLFLFDSNGAGQSYEDENGNVYFLGDFLEFEKDGDHQIDLNSASLRTLKLQNKGAGKLVLEVVGNMLLDLNPTATNTQKYNIEQVNYHLDIQGQGAGQNAIVRLAAADGDTTDTVEFSLFAKGTCASHPDREQFTFEYDATTGQFAIESNYGNLGASILRDIVIRQNDLAGPATKTIFIHCHADNGVTIGDGVSALGVGTLAVKSKVYANETDELSNKYVNYVDATRITSAQSLTSGGSFQTIIYNNEVSDADSVYNTTTGELSPGVSGMLNIDAGMRLAASAVADKFIILKLYKNGSAHREMANIATNAGNQTYRLSGSFRTKTTNSDVWTVKAFQDTGVAIDIPTGFDDGTFLEAFVIPD